MSQLSRSRSIAKGVGRQNKKPLLGWARKIPSTVEFLDLIKWVFFVSCFQLVGQIAGQILCQNAWALELDWSGQFWSEYNFVHNYAMDNSPQGAVYDPVRGAAGGYYVPGGGYQDATFQSVFLRLRPKVIVNDNIYIKSEWWVGDPIYGIFGSGLPYPTDQRQFYSSQSRGSLITAQRIWGEFVTDVGTFQVGRVPLQWGLGLVWNSGNDLWSRYMSTGDAIRWIAKFGSFSFIPSFIVNSAGNNIGGSCNVSGGVCTPGVGMGGVTDYSILLKYESIEDELEGGVNVIKRLAGANQDQAAGVMTPQGSGVEPAGSMNFITYDVYARKTFDKVTLGGEVPIVSGTLGASNYQTFGIAGEGNWKVSDAWEMALKTGYAAGQPNDVGSNINTFRAFYFNPNYHIGMIMFNYQLANFAGPQTLNNPSLSPNQLASPYNNPIVDAEYLALSSNIKPGDKWTLRPAFICAIAPQAAANGKYYYNYWTKSVYQNNTGSDQSSLLGWEVDLGLTFQWDEYFQFNLDNGMFVPGGFYAFSNTGVNNSGAPVFATSVRVGVNF